ncbi:MAG: hypothetical protein AAGA46_02430 [Cyanobacteria bacterium P01_F01_bin.13]
MDLLRSTLLGLSVTVFLLSGWELRAYGQSLSNDVAASLARLDRSICLQQWGYAIEITSELIASPDVSAAYRQELLTFRRQLQIWQLNPSPSIVQASCDRTLPLFLTLEAPTPPPPQPLDWNRALATLANPGPIIELDDGFESTANVIPTELTASSPEILADWATPIDTTDGFSVVGGQVYVDQQVYSFLSRFGDPINLDLEVTRAYIGGASQLFLFNQAGRLMVQSDPTNLQASIENFVIPQTDVYFAVVGPQGTTPVLDGQGLLVGWQTAQNSRFDYTLTLTGVTPYQALLP